MPPGAPLGNRGVFSEKGVRLQFSELTLQTYLALRLQSGPEAGSFTLVSPGFGPTLTPQCHQYTLIIPNYARVCSCIHTVIHRVIHKRNDGRALFPLQPKGFSNTSTLH